MIKTKNSGTNKGETNAKVTLTTVRILCFREPNSCLLVDFQCANCYLIKFYLKVY